jgi:hypothetical protein
MPVPYGKRFPIEFEEMFPDGALMVGAVEPDMEYLSREEQNRGRKPKQNKDDITGLLLWKVTVTDPSATRKNDASVVVVIAAPHQPVPPEGVEIAPGVKVRLVVFEGLTVTPKLEGQGEYKRLGYTARATGMRGVQARSTSRPSSAEQKPAA